MSLFPASKADTSTADANAALSNIIVKANAQISNSDRDAAAQRYIDAKRKEEAAKAERLAAEDEIVKLFGAKEKGASSFKTAAFKVTTTGNLDNKIDEAAYLIARALLPKGVAKSLVKTKIEPAMTAINALKESDPQSYAIFSTCLTTKAAKTSVSVEIL